MRSLKIGVEENRSKDIAISLSNIAGINVVQGKYAKAMKQYTRCLDIAKQMNNKKGIAIVLNNIGEIVHKQGDSQKAIEYSLKSLSVAKEADDLVRISNAYKNLSEYYKAMERFDEALPMYQDYIKIRDSIYRVENKEAMINQEYKYKYEKEKALDDTRNRIVLEKQKLYFCPDCQFKTKAGNASASAAAA